MSSMSLENIVTNLELSQKLKEIGVKQESILGARWVRIANEPDKPENPYILDVPWKPLRTILIAGPVAFTAQELWDILKDKFSVMEVFVNNDAWNAKALGMVYFDQSGRQWGDVFDANHHIANCLAQLIIAQREDKSE